MRDAPRKLLKALLRLASWPLALLILFEEWGWEPLHAALVRLSTWLGLRGLEERIRKLRPYPALALFVVPSLMLLPIKVAALALIAHGHALGGLLVIVFAKLAGTAVVARLFALTQPALLQLAWFARTYSAWLRWKEALLAQVRASWPWRAGRVIRRRLRRRWKSWARQAPP